MTDESKRPILSAVIETTNTAPDEYERLDEVLHALSSQTLSAEEFEIIVVVDKAVHPDLRDHLSRVAPSARISGLKVIPSSKPSM